MILLSNSSSLEAMFWGISLILENVLLKHKLVTCTVRKKVEIVRRLFDKDQLSVFVLLCQITTEYFAYIMF